MGRYEKPGELANIAVAQGTNGKVMHLRTVQRKQKCNL